MLTCREFAHGADHLLDGNAPWHRRVAFRIHLFICADCRRYLRQLRDLVRAIPFMYGEASDEDVRLVMQRLRRQGPS